MQRDGYFGDYDEALRDLVASVGQAVFKCLEIGLPPVFCWVYDPAWQCFQRLAPVIEHTLGGKALVLPDFWAWHVDPSKSESGWRPHRDRNFGSLAPDGAPLSLTCWIPLSDANPMNGCMYIVPAHADPHYNSPQAGMHIAAQGFLARALPAAPGEYLIWNQAVLHWGGASSEFASAPRMSIALEFQRAGVPAFNTPLLELSTAPSFEKRLKLIAKQILQYKHMYGFSSQLTGLATALS